MCTQYGRNEIVIICNKLALTAVRNVATKNDTVKLSISATSLNIFGSVQH